MAVLIERACTPVFASKMDVDSNSDGVVDGFTSTVDSGITAAFALNDSAQKIDMTASTAAGNAKVSYGMFEVSPNTVYSFQVLTRGIVASGNFVNNISIAWYDSANVTISYSDVGLQTPTAYWKLIKLENITSPSNAVKARIYLRCNAQAAGDTGSVWFRNVMLEQSTICSTFCTTTRAADSASMNIAPLTGEWAISGAFALPYASTAVLPTSGNLLAIVCLDDSAHPNDNILALFWDASQSKFRFAKYINAKPRLLYTNAVSFSAWQMHKFVISQSNTGMHMFIRKNNSSTIEAHNTNIEAITVDKLFAGYYNSAYNPLGLIESVTLYRNKAIATLAEANAIFDSMNAEMVINGGFDNGSTGWVLSGGDVWENGMLKKVSTNAVGVMTAGSWQNIKVLPNNTYKIKARLIGYIDTNNKPILEIKAMDIFQLATCIRFAPLSPTAYDQICETTITTSPNAYYISLHSISRGSGTFYWDDISVKLVN